ncbi:hypothetical protein D3C79_1067900 [compost metagenome]
MPETKIRGALYHQKLFSLGVVIVPATRDTWMRCEVRKLATVTRLEHFNEHATLVTILGDFVSEALLGQVTDIG